VGVVVSGTRRGDWVMGGDNFERSILFKFALKPPK